MSNFNTAFFNREGSSFRCANGKTEFGKLLGEFLPAFDLYSFLTEIKRLPFNGSGGCAAILRLRKRHS